MTTVQSVAAIYRYPVKSMAGESLTVAGLTSLGIPGDRAWAVRDEVRGGIRGGKRFAGLMSCAATFTEEPGPDSRSKPARIDFPDGSSALTTDPDIGERLTRLLAEPVTLWPLLPADALDHYRRGAPASADVEAELRSVFARTAAEPLPDLSSFPPELFEYESPLGTYFDAFPILLMSQRGLRTLAERTPDAAFDVRRFRPTLLVGAPDDHDAASGDDFPEDAWVGKQLRIGNALLRVELPCPRCVMTTHAFADLPRDPSIMRTLVREHGGNLGVYASVVEPGIVRLGDSVAIQHD